MKEKEMVIETEITVRFPKEKILKSAKYQERKDLVSALLTDGKEYSLDEVDALIDKFLNRKVG